MSHNLSTTTLSFIRQWAISCFIHFPQKLCWKSKRSKLQHWLLPTWVHPEHCPHSLPQETWPKLQPLLHLACIDIIAIFTSHHDSPATSMALPFPWHQPKAKAKSALLTLMLIYPFSNATPALHPPHQALPYSSTTSHCAFLSSFLFPVHCIPCSCRFNKPSVEATKLCQGPQKKTIGFLLIDTYLVSYSAVHNLSQQQQHATHIPAFLGISIGWSLQSPQPPAEA